MAKRKTIRIGQRVRFLLTSETVEITGTIGRGKEKQYLFPLTPELKRSWDKQSIKDIPEYQADRSELACLSSAKR